MYECFINFQWLNLLGSSASFSLYFSFPPSFHPVNQMPSTIFLLNSLYYVVVMLEKYFYRENCNPTKIYFFQKLRKVENPFTLLPLHHDDANSPQILLFSVFNFENDFNFLFCSPEKILSEASKASRSRWTHEE